LQLGELVRLFEILDLPIGMINDPNSREAGLAALIAKTQETVDTAVKAKSRLDGDFTLWGEPLIAKHIAEQHKSAAKRITDMLGNFASRFNTVAKLNNFTYTMAEIENLGADIAAVRRVMEYDEFKNACADNVNYLTNIELLPIGDSLKERIETAKTAFRKIRGSVGTDGVFGETAAIEINGEMTEVKNAYIDVYFGEHKKRRLTATEYKRKVELMDSAAFANLKRLSALEEILPASKLKTAENELAALKICYEITPETLKGTHICPKCGFTLGGGDPLVKGAVDRIEDRFDTLVEEWTATLLNTINDPLVLEQKQYLTLEQQKTVDGFVTNRKLPEKVDQFFITAVKALLEGFDAVTVNGTELMDKLVALGACDIDTFKGKIDEIVAGLSKGKDKSKLRIIIKG